MFAVCDSLYKKTGGFMKGICHPDKNFKLLRGAGLQWVRRDIPYPFDKDGNLADDYVSFKATCEKYAAEGIYSITITPCPQCFLDRGIDVKTPKGLEKAAEICEFIAKDYKGMKNCWQVTNEMHIVQFRAPLTAAEAKDFIVACANGMKRGDPGAAVGHNSCEESWFGLCREIEGEVDGGLDYIGVDLYDGTWCGGGPETYSDKIDKVYQALGKPVVLMEFGFASRGGFIDRKGGEVARYFNSLGFKDIDDAHARLDEFLGKITPRVADIIKSCAPEDRKQCIDGFIPHLLKKWWSRGSIEHTEEGQAEFYTKLLSLLLANPCVGGAVIYCWRDSERCGFCWETDCPCETAWGLLRVDGSLKPSYEAVKKAFNQTK